MSHLCIPGTVGWAWPSKSGHNCSQEWQLPMAGGKEVADYPGNQAPEILVILLMDGPHPLRTLCPHLPVWISPPVCCPTLIALLQPFP